MRIVVVGYGEMFKALISGILKTNHELAGVFRHDNIMYNPIKRFFYDIFMPSDDYNFVKLHNLYDIKSRSVNSRKFVKEIRKLNADIIIVGSWSEKFFDDTIQSPNVACINLHPSLLPKYRGPNPYIQVILHNEKQTGITFHYMDSKYDHGLILHQAAVPIEKNDTGKNLKLKCCSLASREITKILNEYYEYEQTKYPQDELISSYQKRVSLDESVLNFKKESADEIDRRIRAFCGWINCYIYCRERYFMFSGYKIHSEKSEKPAGCIVDKTENSLSIVCKDGIVIEFSSIKMLYPFSKILTKFYMKRIIKAGDYAL